MIWKSTLVVIDMGFAPKIQDQNMIQTVFYSDKSPRVLHDKAAGVVKEFRG